MKIRLIEVGLLPTVVVAEEECKWLYENTDLQRPKRAIVINDEYYYLLKDIVPQVLKIFRINYEGTFSIKQNNEEVCITFPTPLSINVLNTIADEFEVRGDDYAICTSTEVSGKTEVGVIIKVEEILKL